MSDKHLIRPDVECVQRQSLESLSFLEGWYTTYWCDPGLTSKLNPSGAVKMINVIVELCGSSCK